jgi:lipopolysaccharide export system permease protein
VKRIDRLVLKDVIGPWTFGVGLFTALIMAATYLGRVAGFIVDGVPLIKVGELTGLYMPAILVKTFSMAVLLAGLLGFGRLSSDSEIVALRAGGASVYRIIAPVAAFAGVVTLLTLAFNELVVPAAASKADVITEELFHRIHPTGAQPYMRPIVKDEKLKAAVIAENVNPANQELEGVTVVAYNDQGQVTYMMFADEVGFTGLVPDENNWSARGHVRLVPADLWSDKPGTGSEVYKFNDGIWPAQIPRPNQAFQQFTSEGPDDFDSQSMAELKKSIAYHQSEGDRTAQQIRNYEYGYWNKLAVPLAAITFGILGAALGIRNHRTGTAAGMAIAIAIIFGNVTLANFMNVWASGGSIPPWCASFAPLAIMVVASGVIMWRRNS